jgi:hypothetical protein
MKKETLKKSVDNIFNDNNNRRYPTLFFLKDFKTQSHLMTIEVLRSFKNELNKGFINLLLNNKGFIIYVAASILVGLAFWNFCPGISRWHLLLGYIVQVMKRLIMYIFYLLCKKTSPERALTMFILIFIPLYFWFSICFYFLFFTYDPCVSQMTNNFDPKTPEEIADKERLRRETLIIANGGLHVGRHLKIAKSLRDKGKQTEEPGSKTIFTEEEIAAGIDVYRIMLGRTIQDIEINLHNSSFDTDWLRNDNFKGALNTYIGGLEEKRAALLALFNKDQNKPALGF